MADRQVFDGIRVVDLTHALTTHVPLMPFQKPLEMATILNYSDGGLVQSFTVDEHQGTHVDAAAHFVSGGETVENICPEKLLTTGYLVDVRSAVHMNRDYAVSPDDIIAFERSIGERVSVGVVVAWTGLAADWSDADRYYRVDEAGRAHFPGFGLEAAEMLVEERSVVGLGIDGPSVDIGIDAQFTVHQYALGQGIYHIENLCGLEEIRASTFGIVVGPIKLAGGSAAPARVYALVRH